MNLTFDLETIGTEDPSIIAEIIAGVTPPKTMSKPETIAAWTANDKPALVKEAIAKTSFNAGLGKIICIGFAVDDALPEAISGADEAELIRKFYWTIVALNRRATTVTVIGHNIIGFDLPYLWKRSIVHGIQPLLTIPFKAKPWDENIRDTQQMWDGKEWTKLQNLCRYLGVPSSKSEMDGSMVWDYYREGRIEEIKKYCLQDVEATRECYRRMSI